MKAKEAVAVVNVVIEKNAAVSKVRMLEGQMKTLKEKVVALKGDPYIRIQL